MFLRLSNPPESSSHSIYVGLEGATLSLQCHSSFTCVVGIGWVLGAGDEDSFFYVHYHVSTRLRFFSQYNKIVVSCFSGG